MNLARFLLLLLAFVSGAIATILGFDSGWLGIDATQDYGGWLALSLTALVASYLIDARP